MAERKFDYNSVGTVYNQMKSINDNIKTLLMETDTEVRNRVDVCDEAIFGDLGNQLLLSWDNMSSDFPMFVDNFENWSALVAKASGDYSQFEADMAAFNNANPLGVNSAGAEYGAVATSSYNDSLTTDEIAELDAATFFYEQTGAEYVDTGMVKYAKTHKTLNIITDAIEIVSFIPVAGAAGKAVGSAVKTGAKAAGKAASKTATKVVAKQAAKKAAGEVAEKVAKNGVKKAGQVAAKKAAQEVAEKAAKEGIEAAGEKIGIRAMRKAASEGIEQASKKMGHAASKAIAKEAAEEGTEAALKTGVKTKLKTLVTSAPSKLKATGTKVVTAVKHPIATGKAGVSAIKNGVKTGVQNAGTAAKNFGSRIVKIGGNVKTGVKNAGTAVVNYAKSPNNIVYKNFNPVVTGKYGKFATGAAVVNIGSDIATNGNAYNPATYSNQSTTQNTTQNTN